MSVGSASDHCDDFTLASTNWRGDELPDDLLARVKSEFEPYAGPPNLTAKRPGSRRSRGDGSETCRVSRARTVPVTLSFPGRKAITALIILTRSSLLMCARCDGWSRLYEAT
jgi:hypothetical protein